MLAPNTAPWTEPYGLPGSGLKSAGPTPKALKRACIRMGVFDGLLSTIDGNYNAKLESSLDQLDPGKNGYGKGRWELIRSLKVPAGRAHAGEHALDAVACKLLQAEAKSLVVKPETPSFGPISDGGIVLIDNSLTHNTDGIPLYPAFDTSWYVGQDILAPERLVVSRDSSSRPGKAFYATGDSKLRYWFGHLDRTHYEGQVFNKGAFMGNVAPNYIGGGPHCHVGINVELLLGWGKQLLYGSSGHGPDYSKGSPTIRAQMLGKW